MKEFGGFENVAKQIDFSTFKVFAKSESGQILGQGRPGEADVRVRTREGGAAAAYEI